MNSDNRLNNLLAWLDAQEIGADPASLRPASSDASFRRYYRVTTDHGPAIVMDAPSEHEDCRPFVDISARLRNAGLLAPEIKAEDLQNGFLLLEDFGDEWMLDSLKTGDEDNLYKMAMEDLLRMQKNCSPAGLPAYDKNLLLREMQLFPDWLLAEHLGIAAVKYRDLLSTLFELLVENAREQNQVFVHRDYHSRNLMIVEDELGILDFQDALSGPISYDLVSILKDCYIQWPEKRIQQWLTWYYNKARSAGLLEVDFKHFRRWFDLMGVQRHLKASGIFARLAHRDGKHGYLKDIPRTLSYIQNIAPDYPELEPLSGLIRQTVLPALETAQ